MGNGSVGWDVARFDMFDVSWDFETGSSAEMVIDQSVVGISGRAQLGQLWFGWVLRIFF